MSRDANNFLRILEAPGSVDNYFLSHAKGEEGMSTPYLFTLHLRSRGDVPAPGEWINSSVTFGMAASDSDMRKINGQCVRFEKSYQKDNYVEFELDVGPAFLTCKQQRNCRIFSFLSAIDIIEQILSEHNIDYDRSKVNFVDVVREYCVQYWETDFDFCSRLMEEEGIFYYFQYDDGSAPYKHRMYLADNEDGYFDGAIYEITYPEDEKHQGIVSIDLQHMQYTSAWLSHDYNYKAPTSLTPITSQTRFDYSAPATRFYEWPGDYDSMGPGQRLSEFGMQHAEAQSVIMSGVGTYICFIPGARFEIVDKRLQPGERRIAVKSVSHDAHNPYSDDEGEFHYDQTFVAVPSTEPYHPPRVTPKAVVRGPQTAVVVDQTDPEGYGRVKVRFHWDVAAVSTCWLRVAQQWAGDTIGSNWIPRLGWEVLVVFLEGDPDRPVVAAGLYNADDMPPVSLPAKLSQSGWRTRTYPQGSVVNELIFEDKDGGEEIYLYAGRDFRREVVEDELATIKRDRTTKVERDQSLKVERNRSAEITKDDELKVGGDLTVEVTGDQSSTVDGDRDTEIKGDDSLTVDGELAVEVKKDASVSLDKGLTIKIEGDFQFDGRGDGEIKTKGQIRLSSETGMSFEVGGSKIELSSNAITIQSDTVVINGSLVRIN